MYSMQRGSTNTRMSVPKRLKVACAGIFVGIVTAESLVLWRVIAPTAAPTNRVAITKNK